MFFFKRRRLFFWLIRAYIKKSGKTILVSFFVGFILFILIIIASRTIVSKMSLGKQQRIGLVGAYTIDTLPSFILQNASMGLTTIGKDDTPKPGIAKSWIIEQNGKVYKFDLENDLKFSDGSPLTSADINYNYSDINIQRVSPYALIITLKDNYSPFLVTVAKPIFKGNYSGVGQYRIANIDFNGDFVQDIRLVNTKNSLDSKTYDFYPTQDALKSAYALGEVNKVMGLSDTSYDGTDFAKFNNTQVTKTVDTSKLVTVFFNTSDSNLSDVRIRDALTYALPNTFPQGQREYTPYPRGMWFSGNEADYAKNQDFTHASLLLQAASVKKTLNITLDTFPEYMDTAKIIQANWKKINVNAKIQVVDTIPGNFQAFLYAFNEPQDPDQYVLWHSGQANNISNYRNLRIDKLLEDGRKTSDIATRKSIYADFEKYLVDDAPAAFLYFPYEYTLAKK